MLVHRGMAFEIAATNLDATHEDAADVLVTPESTTSVIGLTASVKEFLLLLLESLCAENRSGNQDLQGMGVSRRRGSDNDCVSPCFIFLFFFIFAKQIPGRVQRQVVNRDKTSAVAFMRQHSP